MRTARLTAVALTAADALSVATLRPHDLVAHVLAARHWIAAVGPDRALAELAAAGLWLACCWLAVGLLAAAAEALPGRVGTGARRVAGALLPGAVHRLVAGSVGLGVLLAPVAACAGPTTPAAPAPSTASASLLPPTWPTDRPTVAPPVWPTEHVTRPPVRTTAPATPRPAAAQQVTVRPGDSLWRIAAQRLGPGATAAEIDREWPRWYTGNRTVIGADPDIIRPGQVLRPPAGDPSASDGGAR